MSGEHGLFFGGGIMWLIWLVLIIAFVYIIKTMVTSDSTKMGNGESPIDILNKRLARGEIDEGEYHRLRNEIEND